MVYVTKDGQKTILWGKSTDDKDDAYELVTDKNDVVIFREVDSGKDYVYNDGEWYEFAESSSGGGGGGGAGVLVLSMDPQTQALNKTWNEINDAKFAVLPLTIADDTFIYVLAHIAVIEEGYIVDFVTALSPAPATTVRALTNTASGYPVVM